MITKIEFDTISIDSLSSSTYRLVDDDGFNPNSRATYIRLPESNADVFVSAFNNSAKRTIDLLLVGSSQADFINKAELLKGYEQNTYTFTVSMESFTAGVPTTVKERKFEGIITNVERINEKPGQIDYGTYRLKIESEDRYLEDTTATTESAAVTPGGYTYPYTYGYTYSGASNTITIENTGTADAYPIFTLTGGGTNWSIVTDNTAVDSTVFQYNGTIVDDVDVTINATDSDIEKVRSEGVTLIGNTNFNWEALVVPAGETVTFTINIESGFTANTLVAISFNALYKY